MQTSTKLLVALCSIAITAPVLAKSKHIPIYVPAAQTQAIQTPETVDPQKELESLSGWDLYDLSKSVKKELIMQQFKNAGQDLQSALEEENDRRTIENEKLDRKLAFFGSALLAACASVVIHDEIDRRKAGSPWWALAPVGLWAAGWCYPLAPRSFNYLMETHEQQAE